MALTNTSDRRVDVRLGGSGTSLAFDFQISSRNGRTVWTRLGGRSLDLTGSTRTLRPAETLTFSDVWYQTDDNSRPVPPGTYLVRGIVPSPGPAGDLRTEQQALTIIERPSS